MKFPAATVVLICLVFGIQAQQTEFSLTFTSDENGSYVPFDSIRISNLSRAGDTTLYYPDTVLNLDFAAGTEYSPVKTVFSLHGNYPNPFRGTCKFDVSMPATALLSVSVIEITGRQVAHFNRQLSAGRHVFEFTAGPQPVYIATATVNESVKSIKMVSIEAGSSNAASLKYLSQAPAIERLNEKNSSVAAFAFSTGDRLQCTVHAVGRESGFVVAPLESDTLVFQFATAIPCPVQEFVEYLGQTYGTVQIAGQCWMQENLNAGNRIDGELDQTDNNILEKYCYDDDTLNCALYGGMYMWDEMMAYTDEASARGICPPGWHVPSDAEWTILEGIADSLYSIADPVWDVFDLRGYDAGKNLKSTSSWEENGNGTDKYGFTGLPAGTRSNFGEFILQGRNAPFWTSTSLSEETVIYRILLNNTDKVYRYSFDKDSGFAVRCIKDM